MSMSVYLSKKVLEHNLGVASYTPPATLYLALFTSSGGLETNVLGSQTEVSGNGYARTAVTGADFSVDAVPEGSNTSVIDFPTVSGGSWGTVSHMAVMDAATSGNVLFWAELTSGGSPAPIAPNDTDIVRYQTGSLTFLLD